MSPVPERVSKDMGITHADFHRIRPGLFPDAQVEVFADGLRARWPDRHLVITLAPETRRRIALLSLPSTVVTIEFFGFTAEQRSAFLTHFDRRFQRGGG